jgi:hypothetical protein
LNPKNDKYTERQEEELQKLDKYKKAFSKHTAKWLDLEAVVNWITDHRTKEISLST